MKSRLGFLSDGPKVDSALGAGNMIFSSKKSRVGSLGNGLSRLGFRLCQAICAFLSSLINDHGILFLFNFDYEVTSNLIGWNNTHEYHNKHGIDV